MTAERGDESSSSPRPPRIVGPQPQTRNLCGSRSKWSLGLELGTHVTPTRPDSKSPDPRPRLPSGGTRIEPHQRPPPQQRRQSETPEASSSPNTRPPSGPGGSPPRCGSRPRPRKHRGAAHGPHRRRQVQARPEDRMRLLRRDLPRWADRLRSSPIPYCFLPPLPPSPRAFGFCLGVLSICYYYCAWPALCCHCSSHARGHLRDRRREDRECPRFLSPPPPHSSSFGGILPWAAFIPAC